MRQRPSGHKRVAAGRNNGLQTTASERASGSGMIVSAPSPCVAGWCEAWSSRLPSTRERAQQTMPSRSRSFVRRALHLDRLGLARSL